MMRIGPTRVLLSDAPWLVTWTRRRDWPSAGGVYWCGADVTRMRSGELAVYARIAGLEITGVIG